MTDEMYTSGVTKSGVNDRGKVPWPPAPPRATIASVGGAELPPNDRVGQARPKETWRDWMPEGAPEPDQILTRDELVERLRYYNVDADTESLRFWEREGILPRPIRQRRNGATRTTYPDWMIYLVRRIRQLQAEGFSLEQIRPRVRRSAEMLLGGELGLAHLSPEQYREAERLRDTMPFWQYAVGAEDVEWPSSLGPALREMARRVEAVTGVLSHHVNVVIVSDDGGETRITVHLQNE